MLILEKAFRKVLSKKELFELEPEGWEEVSYVRWEHLTFLEMMCVKFFMQNFVMLLHFQSLDEEDWQ